jgi:hypothetical protein
VIRTEIEELKRTVEAADTTPPARSAAAKALERLEVLAKMPDNALAVPEDFDRPTVRQVAMDSDPLIREMEPPCVVPESRSAESGEATKELERSEPEPELTPQPTVTVWVAVGAGMVGGALVATAQWLAGWYLR